MSLNDGLPPPNEEVWLPYWELEEIRHNMWGSVENRRAWLNKAIAFTSDHNLYGGWMMRVVDDWPKSCLHNLTKPGDKRPWIGHAAVAMAMQCPEDIVREAWSYLTTQQQALANQKAAEAIEYWRAKNA